MNNILPAIIAKDINELQEKIDQVKDLVSWVQLDIMDGVFVPPVNYLNPNDLKNLKIKPKLELHLMTMNPELKLKDWIDSGVSRILVHAESTAHISIYEIVKELKSAKIEVGVALKLNTDISEIEDLIPYLDIVQLMSIAEIGHYGEAFDARVIPKIVSLREKFPSVKIEVDGGINLESAKELLKAGADNLVVGSTIFKSENIKEIILKLQNL
jgi:ribulose-phosphate 3-epimerase